MNEVTCPVCPRDLRAKAVISFGTGAYHCRCCGGAFDMSWVLYWQPTLTLELLLAAYPGLEFLRPRALLARYQENNDAKG